MTQKEWDAFLKDKVYHEATVKGIRHLRSTSPTPDFRNAGCLHESCEWQDCGLEMSNGRVDIIAGAASGSFEFPRNYFRMNNL